MPQLPNIPALICVAAVLSLIAFLPFCSRQYTLRYHRRRGLLYAVADRADQELQVNSSTPNSSSTCCHQHYKDSFCLAYKFVRHIGSFTRFKSSALLTVKAPTAAAFYCCATGSLWTERQAGPRALRSASSTARMTQRVLTGT